MSLTIAAERRWQSAIWPYVQIARVDHWFKNAFMLLGVVLAVFYEPSLATWSSLAPLGIAVLATCLVASSNYVLNELLDGPSDSLHPEKRHRPVPSGRIRPAVAYVEWLALAAAGFALALSLNVYFFGSALALWIMGIAYNVPPLRTKEWPYLDVLSESVNNPIRLFLGWFALVTLRVPPISLAIAYWMLGAFFMAMKRFAEYRHIGDSRVAAAYRRSFEFYTEERLLVSLFFYATTCALFAGIFIVRYHLELILFTPIGAGIFAYYLHIGLMPNSPVQNPEKLYRQRGFFAYMVFATVLFILLMFTSIPGLYDLFNVDPANMEPLWTLGAQ
ncbi:MAG TPA: UbiA family prenyltransferase [Vicinamibacterales bacterium]|nr:UbiA family prenyltransferase [Vicinamibacterales bacterium]